jgi:hypothetical protein
LSGISMVNCIASSLTDMRSKVKPRVERGERQSVERESIQNALSDAPRSARSTLHLLTLHLC